jgi:hypothetical protein
MTRLYSLLVPGGCILICDHVNYPSPPRSSGGPFHDVRRAPIGVQGRWLYQAERDLPRRRPEPDGSRKVLRPGACICLSDLDDTSPLPKILRVRQPGHDTFTFPFLGKTVRARRKVAELIHLAGRQCQKQRFTPNFHAVSNVQTLVAAGHSRRRVPWEVQHERSSGCG